MGLFRASEGFIELRGLIIGLGDKGLLWLHRRLRARRANGLIWSTPVAGRGGGGACSLTVSALVGRVE